LVASNWHLVKEKNWMVHHLPMMFHHVLQGS
jgi:hypothetical protein